MSGYYSYRQEDHYELPKLGWSWGAYMFPFLYGLTTKSWPCLIIKLIIWFLPNILFEVGLISPTLQSLIKIVALVVAGAYGRRWSFENSRPSDIDKWNRGQRTWNIIGFICFIGYALISLVLYLLASLGALAIGGALLPFSLFEFFEELF